MPDFDAAMQCASPRARFRPSSFDWLRACALDLFRITAGVALALHFGRHALASGAPFGAIAQSTAGFAFALATAAGIAPRLCALLAYGVSIAMRGASGPRVELDPYVASLTALFLALMPIGRSLSPVRRVRAGSSRSRYPIPAGSLLIQWWLLYLSGAPAQAGAAHAPLTHGVLAASVLLLFEPAARGDDRPVVDTGGAVAILHALLFVVALLGSPLGAPSAAAACASLLSDFALYPPF